VRGPAVRKEGLIDAIVEELKALESVHAVWEGGAAAFGRLDKWSDIDLYVLVDDKREDDAFSAVERGIRRVSSVKVKYDMPQGGWPGAFQAYYKVEGASDYLILDLAVVTPSSPEKFLDVEVHGEAVFHFNRLGTVRVTHSDLQSFSEKLRKRVARLKVRDEVFSIMVQKEINRGNLVEALDMYRVVVLDSLVESLRMLHNPYHHDFRTRYIHYELPKEIVTRLEDLYIVRDLRDLQDKYRRALKWYREILKDLEAFDFDRKLAESAL
jgi:predicted nucleotidyltransferase